MVVMKKIAVVCLLSSVVTSQAAAVDARMGLISSTNCVVRFGSLVSCRIPDAQFAPAPVSGPIPVRTTITRNITGPCQAAFPYEVVLEVPGDAPQVYRWAQDASFILRLPNGAVVPKLVIRDGSPWTVRGQFKLGCFVELQITFNEPDVSSRAEAAALIAKIEADIAKKRQEAARYYELLLFNDAYSLMRGVANKFYSQLSNEGMLELYAAAEDAKPALESMIVGCNGGLSEPERQQLLRLYVALSVLDSPEKFARADGKTMTLAEYLGDKASGVLRVVDSLSSLADQNLEDQRRRAYESATQEVEALELRAAQARTQLAGWLR